MPTIYVDGQPFEVNEKENLLQQCLSLGLDIPYFCWHPALGSVGACRQCAVKQFKDENDSQGKIVMSCMTPAHDGTRISVSDPEAATFRASVIEWLMESHPHDCPICDEGGECHLQDMTVMTGHNYRRYRFKKRTFRNQNLGPFINHEMNRCITCYRCVRFYRDYAGGKDLREFASKNHVYFGRERDGTLENEFSGNLVEVCPTGVFTDKTLKRHYTRKWDLQTAPAVCPHCAVGCNIIAGERYGQLRRILNRYNGEVNGYFLCDRGRFGYEFVNDERRLRWAYVRDAGGDGLRPVKTDAALGHLVSILGDMTKVIGIGSPRASLEANYALKTLVGPERFHLGVSDTESGLLPILVELMTNGTGRPASLHEAEQADGVLVLGEDVANTAPRLALSLRQAVRQRAMDIADQFKIDRWQDDAVREAAGEEKSPLFIATGHATGLDDVAAGTYHGAPDDIARFGFAIAHAISPDAPDVKGLPKRLRTLCQTIADSLKAAKRPLVVSGVGCGSESVLRAAANVVAALTQNGQTPRVCLAAPECNSVGITLLGGRSLAEALNSIQSQNAETVIVLENDLYRRADRASVDQLYDNAKHVVVIDHLAHETASKAEVVLPAGTFAEASGTLVSSEGRAQRSFQIFKPADDVNESWRWLRDIGAATGHPELAQLRKLDDIIEACAADTPPLNDIKRAAPPADFRISGLRVPRQPHRYSGRTAMHAQESVHEHKPPIDPDSPFSYTMEGFHGEPPAPLTPFYWAPAWNSVQATAKFQNEVGGPLRGGDPGVPLFEPADIADASPSYATELPPAFRRREGQSLLVPLYHVFGSDELSALAPGIAERSPAPYLAMHPNDAANGGYQEGDEVKVTVSGTTHCLPLRLVDSLPNGVAGLPAGLCGLEGIQLPAWSKITGRSQT